MSGISREEYSRYKFKYHDFYREGTCQRVVDGVKCGKPFKGPVSRKYCNEHSAHIAYHGKG